jgi:hypothetical protein
MNKPALAIIETIVGEPSSQIEISRFFLKRLALVARQQNQG